ncbi:MAG TPA: hypothetical protein PLY87_13740 [Planctomycetaceae bacterium]|nr:hypothetical protein [Planctomycetaceae bacterium]HQZ66144.1 hypothetical protein [Planctomycetaceae bacterium]
MMKPDAAMQTIALSLDQRNLAHVLTALAFAGIADAQTDATSDDRCWWADEMFVLQIPLTKQGLFEEAYKVVSSMQWIAGIGASDKGKIAASPHHGLFVADGFSGCNPLLDYKSQGATKSIFKTFSGQQSPVGPLEHQQKELFSVDAVDDVENWLFQEGRGVASWKFDAAVGNHAYDLGFGSNDDQSGKRDPFYPAIELLSMAGAAFFGAPQSWLVGDETLAYSIWRKPISLPLASLAAAGLIDGIDSQTYALTTRGNAYGKGAAYRHFPRAVSH